MKTNQLFERLWEHGRTLRRVGLVLVMCLMAIPQLWGDDRGFWDTDAGYVRLYRNNAYEYGCTVNKNGTSDFSIGNIDSDDGLYWTDAYAKVWGGTDIFNSITFHWRVKGENAGEGPSFSDYNLNWHDNMGGNTNQFWNVTSQQQYCSISGLAAGYYEVEFYFSGAGKDGKTYYANNNGGNYHANFTLRRKITYHTDGSTAGSAPSTEWWDGAATVRDNTGLLRRSDGYVFAGWATSSGASTVEYEPGTSSMSVTLTADLDLYPVWKKGCYFISVVGSSTNGTKNTTDFIAGKSLTNTAVEVNGVTFSKSYYKTNANQTSIKQQYQNPNNFIVYDTKSKATTIRVYVKNTDTSSRNVYYLLAKEGSISESDQTVSLAAGEAKVVNIDASNSKGTRVIFCNNSYNKIFITQIIAIESGTTLPLPGETGYELAFPGRVANHFPNINGIEIAGQEADLKWNYGNVLKLRSGSSKYLKFTTTAATKLQVKIQSGKGFYVCTNKSNPSTTGFLTSGSTAGTKEIYLDAANTYYIMGEDGSNDTKIEKVSFAAHSACTAPTGLAASLITYSGATFTVTDGTNANNYEFYVSTSSTTPTASTTPTYTSTSKTKEVTDLNKNTTYYAWVRTNGGYFHKSAWTALTGTSFKTLDAYDITYNCDGAESGCPSTGVGLALPDPLPSAPYKPGYEFDTWYTNSAKTTPAVAGAAIAANTTLYAKWTKVYATTKDFSTNKTQGTPPNQKTITTSYADYTPFRVDNFFFGATNKLCFESGNPSEKYNGWKFQYSGSTIKFFVENDCSVAVAMGANAGCSIKYTPIDGSETTQNLSTTDNQTTTKDVKGGTMVTLTTTSGSTVTLKSITITDKAACSAPTSPIITGTTSYTAGGTISLTASATGTSGSTTYTWYKGADWATASVSSPVQVESTSGATFTKASCVVGDAGTYWCNISNGTGCEVQVSKTITVVCVSHSVNLSSSGSVTGGTFETSSATVCVGETATLTATPSSGYTFTSWSATGTGSSLSSTTTNPATLTMGTADVTVNATFTPIPVATITLNKTETTLTYGGSPETLSVTSVLPANALDRTYTWSSSNDAVATVTSGGVVSPVAAGSCEIYATANDGSGVKGTCAVTVNKADLSVTATAGTATSVTHNSATLPFTLSSTTGVASVTINVYLNSNDSKVATISDVTAATSGSASATGLSASTTYYFKVKPIGDANHNDGSESAKSATFTTSAAPTLTAIEANTLYQATNMLCAGMSPLGESDTYFTDDAYSTDNRFYYDVLAENGPKAHTVSSTTLGSGQPYEATFTSEIWVKGTSSVTEGIPSAPSIKFLTPSVGGTLYLYIESSSCPVKFKKADGSESNITGLTQVVSGKIYSVTVVANSVYYIYGNGTKNTGFYGLKLVTCTDPGLAFAADSKTTTLCDAAPTNALTNTHSVAVSYTSSDETVATVASDGTLTIKKAGTTTITASSIAQTVSTVNYCADEASYTLTVNSSTAAGLAYGTSTVKKDVGDDAFTNTLTNSNGLTVTYTSSDEDVATIDSEGEVTIKAAGTTIITASSAQQKITSTCYAAGSATYSLTVYNVYTVTYDATDGTCGTVSSKTVTGEVTLPMPTHASYSFDGWYTTAGVKAGNAGAKYSPSGNITLYAKWSGSCAGGGSGTTYRIPVKSSVDDQGSSATPRYLWVTEDIGWITWDKGASSISAESQSYSDFSYRMNSNKSKILIYSEIASVKKIRIYAYGSSATSCNGVSTGTTYDSYSALTETTHYTFNGNSVANGANGVIEVVFVTPLAANTYVQFTFAANARYYGVELETSGSTCHTVTYHGNGATSGYVNDPVQHTAGSDVTVKYNDPTTGFKRTGYEFNGWNTKADASGTRYDYWDIDHCTIEDIAADVDLYAEWRIVINADNTDFAGKDSPTQYKDVKVTNGATLTITNATTIRDIIVTDDATLKLRKNTTAHDVTVETGSTLNINTTNGDGTGDGITLTANSLSLQGGFNELKSKYDMPRVYINPKCTLTRTDPTINFDISVNHRNYYPIALPFDVPLNSVDYARSDLASISIYGMHYEIDKYNGQKRANSGGGTGNWETVTSGETLKAGKGYIMSAITDGGKAIIRFPMNVPNGWTTAGEQGTYDAVTKNEVAVYAYTKAEGETKKANKGWNLLGVPYMSCFVSSEMDADPSDAYIKGLLNIWSGEYKDGDNNIYVTIPKYDFTEYDQLNITEAVLLPGWCFFVQMDEDATITFDKAGERARAPFRATNSNQAKPTVKTGIILSGAEASDKTTILVSDKYNAAEYEINADLEKMFGENGYTLATYSLSGETRLAYNAMSNADAENIIPIGYRAPAEGEYTFSINPRYAENGAFESVNLIDYETGIVTDLLMSSYTFSTDRTQNDARFALNVVKQKETPTGIENGANGANDANGVRKLLLDGKMYIILEGKMFDAQGKRVK